MEVPSPAHQDMRMRDVTVLVAMALLVGSCAPAAQPAPEASVAARTTAAGGTASASPPAEDLCASGREQSPIDLSGAEEADLPDIEFSYEPSTLRIVDTGSTIQNPFDPGSAMTIGDTRWALVQLHYHAPSEHRDDGRSFPIEFHLVHRDDDTGELAVVALFGRVGAENPALATTVAHLPEVVGEEVVVSGETLDASDLLPESTETIRYPGSLTTPPCAEGVRWNVLTQPIEVSQAQLDAYTGVHDDNGRAIQPANGRVPLVDRG